MNWRIVKHRAPALLVAAALTASCVVPAAAEPIGDGVSLTYDEAYYATLDYYGNLLEGSMVKSYALNGKDSLTDYGAYDEVINLTDDTAPTTGAGGTTSFHFSGGAPDYFYFEGKTKQPFEDLPWTLTLRYTLNGVPTKAEDLAGKQGVVEILLDIVPNESASDYARYNYTLAATALFNQDDILSLEAPGAQVQLVGNLRTVLFLCLPGEEQHFTIRVGSDDFSFGGLTVLMVPATLAQLEEIAKLSERKDDLEEDYRALSGSLDNLLSALSDIQGGLYASANGLDQLELARRTFSGGKDTLYNGADLLRGDLSNLASLLEPVEGRIQTLSRTVTESKTVLNEMTDAAQTLQTQLRDLEKALSGLESGTSDLKNVIDLAAGMKNSLRRLEHALGGTSSGGSGVSINSTALVEQVKTVHGAYEETDQNAFMVKMLQAQGMSAAEAAEQVKSIGALAEAVGSGKLPADQLTAEQKEALATAQQMQTLHANKDKMPFQSFCEQLPGVSASQAKQMNDLWVIYSSGEVKGSPSNKRNEIPETPAAPAPEQPQAEAPEEPSDSETMGKGQMAARLLVNAPGDGDGESGGSADDGGGDSGSGDSGQDGETSGSPTEGGDSGETPSVPSEGGDSGETPSVPSEGGDSGETPSGPTEGGDSGETPDRPTEGGDSGEPPAQPDSGSTTVGGAVIDLITEGLDSASSQINRIQDQLTDTLEEIKRPTAVVVGDLADLCEELETVIHVLDDAEDLSAALRQSSGTLEEILGDVDALRTVLNGYEPTLQEALANAGTLSTAAVTTIRDTETLLSDAEGLAKSTGKDLDAGTKQSLAGLSAALRQTAKALATTSDVQTAKNTITDIIEDTWDEYTGDVNNILLMDATAEAVSLTDERNPAPSSIQVLIRTQEIKTEEPEETEETAGGKAQTTFWGRIAQMFRDFWNAITGIFRG